MAQNKKITFLEKRLLFLILCFAFAARLFRIDHPQTYIFDEVYHGFTAQEMAKGNVKAWEWWNAPPEGFAYEWTHPPLAKLIMAGSILLWRQNHNQAQFAFRLPAVFFGTGVVFLTYLLAKTLFKNEKLALLASFLTSIDGLLLTMSRVGMTDIYFLFFVLITIFLALKGKHFYAVLGLGLAIATKWTGIYLYPVLGLILLCHSKTRSAGIWNLYRFLIKSGMTMLIVPIVIYLFSYLPFFTSGHTWAQFTELQRQMWWYHTNLKATHQYQSAAYTWPLMLRPVWFWVNYQKNKVANIYNLGNPWLWWTGILILPYVILNLFQDFYRFRIKSGMTKKLAFLLFAYFIFWVPWIFSPRIMFLHHYLPALPFLFILIAWQLDKIQSHEFSLGSWKIKGSLLTTYYLLLTIVFFLFFSPLNTGVFIPHPWLKYWFWLASWK